MIKGGCRCGAARYTIAVDNLPPIYCCHCLACQSSSGSAFSQQAVIHSDLIDATGPVLDYHFERPDGGSGHHRLCATCFTRLWSTNSLMPGLALVRAGSLDESNALVPRAHIWVKRKQPWIDLPAGAPQWVESAPVADLAKALG